jgi:3-hydroxybutyryl-CoA dehydrogenase
MTEIYGFKMGPFLLMDFIGHDVNYKVTQSIWEGCNFEPRYKPSYTQRNLLYANWLGKKTGRGFYNYTDSVVQHSDEADQTILKDVAWRILVMLINEAADALYYKIATREDIELAMTKGVHYPKGLLKWAEELGIEHCISTMNRLFDFYKEERYRCSPGLKQLK